MAEFSSRCQATPALSVFLWIASLLGAVIGVVFLVFSVMFLREAIFGQLAISEWRAINKYSKQSSQLRTLIGQPQGEVLYKQIYTSDLESARLSRQAQFELDATQILVYKTYASWEVEEDLTLGISSNTCSICDQNLFMDRVSFFKHAEELHWTHWSCLERALLNMRKCPCCGDTLPPIIVQFSNPDKLSCLNASTVASIKEGSFYFRTTHV